MKNNTNIVIIGAGYSGVLTAKRLEKKLRKRDDITITIIDKNPYHTMLTELHEVAANRVDEESIKMSLARIFAGRRVNVVLDKVLSVDFANQSVIGENDTYSYNYLVVAAGSKPTSFGVRGVEEYAYKLWSYNDAIKLREKIESSFRAALNETSIEKRKKLLTFSIIGAGFTGVEMAGELAEYVPVLCDRFEIPRDEVTVNIIDILERPCQNLPVNVSKKILRRLLKMGVKVMLSTKVVEIGEDFIITESKGETKRVESDTIVWVAGIESSELTAGIAKQLTTAGRGSIKTDKYLRSVDDEKVFVVGDNMFYIPEGEKYPVPQMVENCEQSAHAAADNIIAAIKGGDMKEYRPKFHGVMVSVGGRYAVAHVGGERKFSLASFFAMFVKHFINMVYFVQVMGWNKVASYMKHEFFTIRNKRSFVGGHFSNRTPSFLVVPLRLWLGGIWLFEGIMKIVGGWLGSPKLVEFFGWADAWFKPIIEGAPAPSDGGSSASETVSAAAESIGSAVSAAADVISSATGVKEEVVEAGEKVGSIILNFDFLGLFRFIFVSGEKLAKSKIEDFAIRFDVPLIDWFLNNLVLSSDVMQIIMQVMVVAMEVGIGLALMGGLLTTPAALLSLVLLAMFVSTTGLYLSQLWMIFGAIAVICAGRVFGLDYYVMPWLKKGWKKLRFVKRSYLYHD